jgi:hypothetical protein
MDLTKYFVLFILLNYLNVQLYFLNIYTNYKKFKNEFYLDFILIYKQIIVLQRKSIWPL